MYLAATFMTFLEGATIRNGDAPMAMDLFFLIIWKETIFDAQQTPRLGNSYLV